MAPSQVLSSLNDEDARKWVDAFNKALTKKDPSKADVMAARRHAWFSVKDLPSSFSFCIKASVEEVDKQHELITVDSIKKHMDDFLAYGGNINSDHGNYNVGCIWGWDPITIKGKPAVQVWGNLFGGDMVYDTMRKAFINGVNSLSIAGEATPGKFTCDENGCYTRRDMRQILEMSLTKRPVNTSATMVWYNDSAKVTKSEAASDFRLDVEEYTIHKSETECPILSLRKSLREAGFDAHARKEGCFIPSKDCESLYKSARKAGVSCMKCVDVKTLSMGVFVPTKEYTIKSEFKSLYSKGYVDTQGRIAKSIPKDEFKRLWDAELIDSDEYGSFHLKSP